MAMSLWLSDTGNESFSVVEHLKASLLAFLKVTIQLIKTTGCKVSIILHHPRTRRPTVTSPHLPFVSQGYNLTKRLPSAAFQQDCPNWLTITMPGDTGDISNC